ncbi:hypothetical protein J6590_063388 [Homalodisca vitripennis]|nr:hypothetical protein J6590_063388 [Homalodisca vitripennis]
MSQLQSTSVAGSSSCRYRAAPAAPVIPLANSSRRIAGEKRQRRSGVRRKRQAPSESVPATQTGKFMAQPDRLAACRSVTSELVRQSQISEPQHEVDLHSRLAQHINLLTVRASQSEIQPVERQYP